MRAGLRIVANFVRVAAEMSADKSPRARDVPHTP
jgi:hypothetical protein